VERDNATSGLGQRWELRNNGQKPYACGVVSHPTIDAVCHLREAAGVPAEEIDSISARVNRYVLELMGKTDLSVGLEGKFSIYHCAAIGYIDGAARVRQFTDEAVLRSDVVELRSRVRADTDAALPTSSARVQLTARDGRVWEEFVEAATGTPGNPMSDADLVDKFLDLVTDRLGPIRAKELANRALGAEDLGDTRDLIGLLSAEK
jgi:2-methylcitrate dehydratase PrpD